MRLLKIINKPSKKPTKRIEAKLHSKNSRLRFRASRTGGANASIHPLRGLTLNTKHGLRLSKTFKGLTLGFQGRNSILRGRWNIGKNFNLNLSKSGLSASVKSSFGTYNFKNPNRSSFKFAGIQIRGKKAAGWAFLFAIPNIVGGMIKLIFNILRFFMWVMKPLLFLFGIALRVVLYILGIFLKILFYIFAVFVQVFLIWPLNIIYNLLSIILIDVPIYIINNLAGRELIIENEPSYKKIKASKIKENDDESVSLLMERLEFYDRIGLVSVSLKRRVLYWLLFLLGFIIGLSGIFTLIYSATLSLWGWAFFGFYMYLLGNQMKEPIIRLMRQKQDLELNDLYNIC